MEDAEPRARRRLRQRPPQAEPTPREIIALDSSSDAFEPSSGGQSDSSDVDAIPVRAQNKEAGSATKKRGLKRLRRSETYDSPGSASAFSVRRRAVSSATSEAADAAESEWECAKCTYLNEPRHLSCAICLTARTCALSATKKLSTWLTSAAAVGATTIKTRSSKPNELDVAVSAPVETIDSSDEGESGGRALSTNQRTSSQRSTTTSSRQGDLLSSETALIGQTDELCVQKKKVQEVQEWLQRSIPFNGLAGPQPGRKRLLFLCGPPGSGKSTTVRHLAGVMGATIKQWLDNSSAGKLQYHRFMQDDFHMSQISPWDDFIDFINRSVNYSALLVAAVPERRVKNRPLQPLQTPPLSQDGVVAGAAAQLILVENWPLSPFSKSQDSAVWDEKLRTAFRQVVSPNAHLQYPVVCIFSDVRDKKMDTTQLAKVFSDEVVHSPFTSVINFNPVTAAQMKKTLTKTLERMDWAISAQQLTKVIDNSDGDIRHAANMVQLLQKQQKTRKAKRQQPVSKKLVPVNSSDSNAAGKEEETEQISRDPFISDFHIVGKLLHSKNKAADGSSRIIDFDRMLDSSTMSLDRILSLLHSNFIDYFTDIDDVEQALELMSQSETWLHDSYRATSSSSAFKTSHDLARSVVVRSIALTNENPAPSAFRPITAPRTFETNRRIMSSRQESLYHQKGTSGNSTFPYVCRGDVYAFEIQPFVETIRHDHSTHNGNHINTVTPQSNGVDHIMLDDDIEISDGDGW